MLKLRRFKKAKKRINCGESFSQEMNKEIEQNTHIPRSEKRTKKRSEK